ncbi:MULTISPECIES: LysR family transcriptional regulator [Vibrio]|jgi:DNA-binding transcriptional LysR family regulator|uniref:LysR family transcriptional regulator n=1 Tax=Vibrio mediterranei TaxID=689 RepID=A0AAJ3QM63_9VIBR|nr:MULTISPECIES: LysR family transcriptional regulator [Vibrio]ASI92669.1 LysR family transcriptional regulator [Vibrio mediterranei]KFA97919.1 LysR family transcriptional regulator [Vibrio sp. ER1A]MCF4175896.1 LysR family transcriptional regulator [Vibrio sp. McD22-P3]MCG9657004.1 LysR family transcriptional regulator [Vibrio mediterranei]MCG9662683.1 LysR family transcriptional regulator [Vibrio mediterranei]
MDVKVFQTFLEVAKEKHFGRASENLYITQAAVSARIKQLEEYFDTRLFTRHRNNIQLTSAGQRLIGYAEVMVSTLKQATFDLSLESNKALQLTIGGTPNIWDAYLQNCLSVVTDSLTGYGFVAESLGREQLNRKLLERTLDLAFSFDPFKVEEFKSHQIAELTLVLVSTEQRELDDAFKDKYVYVDWGTQFAFEHADRHPNIPAPYLRTSTGRIALDFILEKGGCAYLPSSLVEPFLDSGQLYQVDGSEVWSRPLFISYRKNSTSIEAILQVEKLINTIEPTTSYLMQQAGENTD